MKMGIVGLGARIANMAWKFHEADPEIAFTAYVDPTPAGLDYLRDRTGSDPKAYGDMATMLAAEDLDALIIGSPNFMHLDHLKTALASDVPHIFCEKPVVTSEEETYALLDAIRADGGHDRVMVGLVLQYSPLYLALQQSITDGQLGDVVSIEACEHIAPYHGAFFMQDWRRFSKMSGGFLLEKCCHDLALYQHVAKARPMQVASFGGRKTFVPENAPAKGEEMWTPERPDHVSPFIPRWGGSNGDAFHSDGDIIDYQTALINYENGVNLCFHTNTNVPDEYRRFAVMGTRGMAEGDFVRNFFRVHDARTHACLIDRDDLDAKGADHHVSDQAMVRDLLGHMSGTGPLRIGLIDALEAGITALKIDEARLSGSVVDLTSTWERFDSYGLT